MSVSYEGLTTFLNCTMDIQSTVQSTAHIQLFKRFNVDIFKVDVLFFFSAIKVQPTSILDDFNQANLKFVFSAIKLNCCQTSMMLNARLRRSFLVVSRNFRLNKTLITCERFQKGSGIMT